MQLCLKVVEKVIYVTLMSVSKCCSHFRVYSSLKKSHFIWGDYLQWCLETPEKLDIDRLFISNQPWMSRLFLFFVTAKATHIYYWCICKIAAIYFMTTFILLEYYKLESRGRFILPILYSEQKIQIQKSQILSNCKSRISIP